MKSTNNSFESSKQKILTKITDDLVRLHHKRYTIQNLKLEPITESKWKELCDIKEVFNNKDILLKFAKVTFPNGTDWKLEWDCIKFKLNNIKISLKMTSDKDTPVINIHEEWLDNKNRTPKKDKGKPIKINSIDERNIRKFMELINSNKYHTYYSVGRYLYNPNISHIKRFSFWIFRDKKNLNLYIKNAKKYIEKYDKQYTESVKKYYKQRRYIIKQVENLKQIIPELKYFGELNIDEESIFNFQPTINNKPVIKLGEIKETENKYNEFINKLGGKYGRGRL